MSDGFELAPALTKAQADQRAAERALADARVDLAEAEKALETARRAVDASKESLHAEQTLLTQAVDVDEITHRQATVDRLRQQHADALEQVAETQQTWTAASMKADAARRTLLGLSQRVEALIELRQEHAAARRRDEASREQAELDDRSMQRG